MAVALNLGDLTRLNQAALDQITELEAKLDPAAGARHDGFSRQVAAVEAALNQTFKAAALLVKFAADRKEAAQTWKIMSEYAGDVMTSVSLLKDRYPESVAAGLYNLARDYQAAADKFYRANLATTRRQKNS